MKGMQRNVRRMVPYALGLALVVTGCATKKFVGREVGRVDGRVSGVETQVEDVQTRLTTTSRTAQEALDRAMAAGKLAVQYAPNNPDAHYTLGLIYEKRGQYAEAERALRAALAANPNYVDVYFTLGALYADELKDQKKAVEAFERYLELGGTHSRAREAVAQSRAAQTPGPAAAP